MAQILGSLEHLQSPPSRVSISECECPTPFFLCPVLAVGLMPVSAQVHNQEAVAAVSTMSRPWVQVTQSQPMPHRKYMGNCSYLSDWKTIAKADRSTTFSFLSERRLAQLTSHGHTVNNHVCCVAPHSAAATVIMD